MTKKSIIIAFLLIPLFVGLVAAGITLRKIALTADRIQIDNPRKSDSAFENIASALPGKERKTLQGEERGRINILLLGRAGEHYPGKNLTDTVMLASIDTKSRQIGFLSLPRDLYVPIAGTNLSTKLNSLYQHSLSEGPGADSILSTAELVTGQDIPYFITIDFDGFEKVIDDIGGIRIFSERDILDTRYPGKNYSYETFELPAGWHTLDGKTALKYARERHSDPEGDFGRAKRQQQIIMAAQEKIVSSGTILNPFTVNRLLETLGESIRTNLSIEEMLSLAEMAGTIDFRNSSTVVVDAWKKDSLLRVSHLDLGGVRAFILVPRTGNWNEIRETASELFDQETVQKRLSAIGTEGADILIFSRQDNLGEATKLSRLISETYPGTTTKVKIHPSLEKNGKSAIIDRTQLSKPFTLDSLLKSFSLEKKSPDDLKIAELWEKEDPDFIILLGDEFNSLPSSGDTLESVGTLETDDPFSELFPVQESR